MAAINNGGPVHPRPLDPNKTAPAWADPRAEGLQIRDYFASAALPMAATRYLNLTGNDLKDMFGSGGPKLSREDIIAVLAYQMADAMIKMRGY